MSFPHDFRWNPHTPTSYKYATTMRTYVFPRFTKLSFLIFILILVVGCTQTESVTTPSSPPDTPFQATTGQSVESPVTPTFLEPSTAPSITPDLSQTADWAATETTTHVPRLPALIPTGTNTTIPTPRNLAEARRNTPGVFYSSHVGDHFQIYLQLPEGYDPEESTRYPVIYLLDGDWYFGGSQNRIGGGGVAGTVPTLNQSGQLPPIILVGIGYPGENYRGRDFLVGVEKFYLFLQEELIPTIDERYNTDPSEGRTLIGHSDGGFFCIYAFFQTGLQPEPLFSNFITISGDYTKLGIMMNREEKLFERMQPANELNAKVFMAVGGREESRFIQSSKELAEVLESRDYAGFQIKYLYYEEHSHSTIVGPAIKDGLKWVFP
jgi:enterochelin esterase-like enzyme